MADQQQLELLQTSVKNWNEWRIKHGNIIADLTEPSSIPHELQAIIPTLAISVQPILLEKKEPMLCLAILADTIGYFPFIFIKTKQVSLIP